jgi:hypothetical protein
VVPTAIAGALTAGVAAIPAAAVSSYRAHSFEKNFWDFIKRHYLILEVKKQQCLNP